MAKRAIVAIFATQNQAYDAARDISLLGDGVVHIDEGAIITKDAKGNLSVPEAESPGAGWGTAGGAILGGLIGLLAGPAGAVAGLVLGGATGALVDLADLGADEDFLARVGSELHPGESALAAVVDEGSTEPVDRVVAQNGGRIFRTAI